MNFKEIYDKASNEYKSEFLYPLLSNNPTLKKQFLEKVEVIDNPIKKVMDFSEFNDKITSSYEEYKEMMESLELEEHDWEDYTPRHSGYISEWEAIQHMAEDEADELFSFFEEDLITLLLQNNLEELLGELISFYFAAVNAEINDPNDNLGDDYFKYEHKKFVKNIIEKISHSNISDEKINNAISLFFKYFESQNEEEHKGIKAFEQLLILLVDKINDKQILLPIEKLTSINIEYYPLLAIKIDKKSGNKKA